WFPDAKKLANAVADDQPGAWLAQLVVGAAFICPELVERGRDSWGSGLTKKGGTSWDTCATHISTTAAGNKPDDIIALRRSRAGQDWPAAAAP
ncbi:MAG: hypothetical protein KAW89_07000, partial [Armatimonadetes bacterium]|nr:hypothetical protein [Armatimonadota bacterium]